MNGSLYSLWAAGSPQRSLWNFFAFSIAFHLTIVGIASSLPAIRPPPPVEAGGIECQFDVDPVETLPTPPQPPNDPDPLPTPDEITASDFSTPAPPPPVVTPPAPAPSSRTPSRPASTSAPARIGRSAGQPGPATVPARGVAFGWSTPKPGYPYLARRARLMGIGRVEAWTDPAGRVIRCEVRGLDAMLTQHTERTVLATWRGPASAQLSREIEYRLEE